jgi:hypothetical protein
MLLLSVHCKTFPELGRNLEHVAGHLPGIATMDAVYNEAYQTPSGKPHNIFRGNMWDEILGPSQSLRYVHHCDSIPRLLATILAKHFGRQLA